MEEPLLKGSIDPLPAPEESKGLNVVQGFLSKHKGADVQVPLKKGFVLTFIKQCYCDQKIWQNFSFAKSLDLLFLA